MAYDVTLGGQQFSADNPSVLFGLLDNLLKIRMAGAEKKKSETEKDNEVSDEDNREQKLI